MRRDEWRGRDNRRSLRINRFRQRHAKGRRVLWTGFDTRAE